MNQGNGGNHMNRGYDGNYPPNQGGQPYPSSSNNMHYNYSMNQNYAGNMGSMGYQENYYPQEGYEYGGEGYEEADYDNLDEIEREMNQGGVHDYEAEMMREMESLNSPSYGHQQQRGYQTREPAAPRSGPYVPQAAMPSQNGKLSAHAHEFWFPEARNCPCCKGFKHGCGCCKNGVDTCTDTSCIDSAFANQVTADLATRTASAPAAASTGITADSAAAPATAEASTGAAPVSRPAAVTSAPAAASGEFCKYESTPGGCRFGATCRFKHSAPAAAHSPAGAYNVFPPAPPSGSSGGPPKCTFFARGACQHGEKCRFSHL